MKKAAILLLVLSMTLGCCTLFTGCSTAPTVDEVYDRVVTLIEDSYALNTVIYGPGLPTYSRDSAFSELNHIYFDFSEVGSYELVTERAKFQSEEEIRAFAETVYSKGLLEDVLYKTMFDGYAVEDGAGGAVYGLARYRNAGGRFCMSIDKDPSGADQNILFTAMRIYDYSTMRVRSLGREDACAIEMESWLPDTPQDVETVELILVKQDGQWYLDSFAGA